MRVTGAALARVLLPRDQSSACHFLWDHVNKYRATRGNRRVLTPVRNCLRPYHRRLSQKHCLDFETRLCKGSSQPSQYFCAQSQALKFLTTVHLTLRFYQIFSEKVLSRVGELKMFQLCVSALLRRSMTPLKTPVLSAVKPAFAPVLLQIIYLSHNISTRTF